MSAEPDVVVVRGAPDDEELAALLAVLALLAVPPAEVPAPSLWRTGSAWRGTGWSGRSPSHSSG